MKIVIYVHDVCRCYDSESGRRMKRRHCGSKKSRPNKEKRPCNIFQCESNWVEGPWENCPVSCGTSGQQYRFFFLKHQFIFYNLIH